ncbi:signal peptidase II [Candidatus Gracilibacteria bacterium]|nr:signal peptidase II [Candidatus Gracilibacteria bacterium]
MRSRIFFIIIPVVLADIFSKYWVNISDPEFSVIGNILRITHVKNTGVAFGTPLPGISFVIPLILLGIGVFLWKSWKKISEIEKTAYLMIIAGGFLNALERTIFGSVTDFISVQYFSVFNVADVAITGGVILLFWEFLFERKK